jgi:polar amino acid transport system substrate-binding protein
VLGGRSRRSRRPSTSRASAPSVPARGRRASASARRAIAPPRLALRLARPCAPAGCDEEGRAEALLFTEGYLDTDYLFVQKKADADIKTLDDLKGKTISVNKGSANESWAKANAEKFGFKFDIYDTNADAVQAVLSGRAGANLAGNTVAAWAAKQNPLIKTSLLVPTGLVWAIPFRKDDVENRDKISMVIKCMKVDGTIGKMHEKWFGAKAAADSSAMKPVAGHGVPNMPGYDATPVALKCS